MSSLIPGAAQVDRFEDEDEEYEYEYETSYATLDLRSIDQNIMLSSSTFKLIGLDTPTPYLQLPGLTMKGEQDTLIGSEMLFSDGRDPNDRSRRFVVPLGTTSTRVTFRSIELQPKFVQNAAPASDEPPPVLFQGRKQSGKAVPKEKFIEGEPTSKVKGKARGRGRGATAAGRGGPKGRKGKSKDGEDNDEDAYPGSDADGDVNYDDMDGDDDGDGDEGVGSRNEAGPSRAPGPSRRSLRPRNTETQMNEALLGGLQAMDVDDTEDGAGMSEGPS